jgi:serine/threonine-protein kinase
MTPERWQQVEALYHAALARAAGQRAAFLSDACGGDEALRAEGRERSR